MKFRLTLFEVVIILAATGVVVTVTLYALDTFGVI